MTTAPDPQTVRDQETATAREQAREIILSHAKDVEHGSIGEHLADFDEFSSLPEDEFAHLQGRIGKQIRHAVVTVSWPDEQPPAKHAYPDSHSPWSQWLTDRLLDREWTSSGLVEASGHVFDLKQVSRWLHSQDVPEPWAAVLAAKAFAASVIDALRAAEHGVMVDAVLEEAAQPAAEQDGDALTAAYRERAHLVALLAAVYPSRWGYDPNATEWRIVYVDLPTGQASWHISPTDVDLFPHVTEDGGDRDWDGHTTAAKYERIRHLTAQTAAAAKHGAENAQALNELRGATRRFLAARGGES